MKHIIVILLLVFLSVSFCLAETTEISQEKLFYREYMGYWNFRIPALCVTKNGTILALAEGRMDNMLDWGNIDLVIRRSYDGGLTWSDGEVIWDYGEQSVSNPTLVQDQETGRIFLFVVLNSFDDGTRTDSDFGKDDGNYYRYSDDDGLTWSEIISVRDVVGAENWPGPVHGIQLTKGEHAGRLVIPLRRCSLYSDDHGETWVLGAKNNSGGETTVVELADGTLLRNDRSTKTDGLRRFSTSSDGGATWSDFYEKKELYEPNGNGCQADHIAFIHIDEDGQEQRYYIQSGPRHRTSRKNMTLMISQDECQTYQVGYLVHRNSAASSAIAQYDNDTIIMLYEDGHAFESEATLIFMRIPLDTLIAD